MTGTTDTRRAAVCILEHINGQIQLKQDISRRIDNDPQDETDQWLKENRWIEIELLKIQKDQLENWIIDNEFPI